MHLDKIDIFLKKRGTKRPWLAKELGMTPQNLSRCIKENKISAEHIEKIADILEVDINEFFDTKIKSSDQTNNTIKQSQKGTGNTFNTGVISGDDKYNKVEIKLKREIESLKKDLKQLKTEVKGLEKEVLLKDEIIILLKGKGK